MKLFYKGKDGGPWQKQWLENTPQDGTYGLVSGRLKVPV